MNVTVSVCVPSLDAQQSSTQSSKLPTGNRDECNVRCVCLWVNTTIKQTASTNHVGVVCGWTKNYKQILYMYIYMCMYTTSY
jgi:hypothetical protein